MRTLLGGMGTGLLLLAAMKAHAGAGMPVRIELAPQVEVTKRDLNLGDVASLTTKDPSTLRRLMALPLGPAPKPGEKAQLGREELARWISQRTGLDQRQIDWTGAAVTQLQRASSGVEGSQLVLAAREALLEWLAEHTSHASVVAGASPRDITVPAGKIMLKVRPVPLDATITKRMVLWVDVWVDDRFVRTVPIGFEVAAYGLAYIAATDQRLDTHFDVGAWNVRETEISGRVAPVLAPGSVPLDSGAGKQLRRTVTAQTPLTKLDLENAPAVIRGEWIALRSKAGSIEMESRVEALQSGRIGQLVSVLPAKGVASVLARVVGPGQVEVGQ